MRTDDDFEISISEDELFDNTLLIKVKKKVVYGENQIISKDLITTNPEALAEITMQMMNAINDRTNCK